MKSLRVGPILIMVGIIFGLPHLLMKFSLEYPSAYTPLVISGVSFVTIDETYSHGARVREVHDGRIVVTDASVYEHKEDPTFFPYASELLLGLFSRFTGVANAFIIADFLLPPVVAALLFLFLFQVTQSSAISVFGSMAILFEGIGKNLLVFQKVLVREFNFFIRPFEFSRFPTPELTFILFVAALICLLMTVKKRRTTYAILGGVLFGLLSYLYFFYWIFFGIGSLIFLLLVFREGDRSVAKLIGVMLLTGALVSIPNWVSYFTFRSLAHADDVVSRIGVEKNQTVILPSVKTLALIIMYGLLYQKMRLRNQLVLQSFMVGSIVCQNIQFLIGFNVYSPHWNYRVVYIWQSIMIFASIPYLLSMNYERPKLAMIRDLLKNKVLNPVCIFFTALLLLSGLTRQAIMSNTLYRAHALPYGFQEAFDWLNENTAKESVVISSSFETNMLLPVYTHNNIFLPTGNSLLSLAPTQEIVDRLALTYCFFQVPYSYSVASLTDSAKREENFRAHGNRFDRERPELLEQNTLWYIAHLKFASFNNGPPREFREALLSRLGNCEGNGSTQHWKYRVDYAWESFLEKQKSSADLAAYPFLEKVYDSKGVRIYRLIGKGD